MNDYVIGYLPRKKPIFYNQVRFLIKYKYLILLLVISGVFFLFSFSNKNENTTNIQNTGNTSYLDNDISINASQNFTEYYEQEPVNNIKEESTVEIKNIVKSAYEVKEIATQDEDLTIPLSSPKQIKKELLSRIEDEKNVDEIVKLKVNEKELVNPETLLNSETKASKSNLIEKADQNNSHTKQDSETEWRFFKNVSEEIDPNFLGELEKNYNNSLKLMNN